MTRRVRLHIAERPVALARPRATVIGGGVRLYPPAQNKEAIYRARLAAVEVIGEAPPLAGPLRLTLTAWMPCPASMAKKRRATARPLTRPDLDNLVKLIVEALHGVLWADDSQLVEIRASKRYALAEMGRRPGWDLEAVELQEVVAQR